MKKTVLSLLLISCISVHASQVQERDNDGVWKENVRYNQTKNEIIAWAYQDTDTCFDFVFVTKCLSSHGGLLVEKRVNFGRESYFIGEDLVGENCPIVHRLKRKIAEFEANRRDAAPGDID